MKKTYLNPKVAIVEIDNSDMLMAGSAKKSSSVGTIKNTPVSNISVSTNAIPEKIKAVRDSMMHNFFGVDLYSVNNGGKWKFVSKESNDSGDIIYTYQAPMYSNPYFFECQAKVIGANATNFIFEGTLDKEHVFDVLHLIERDCFHGGNLDMISTIKKYRDEVNDSFFMIEIECKETNMTFLLLSTSDNLFSLTAYTQISSSHGLKTKEESVDLESKPNSGNWALDFFGLNLPDCPNDKWNFVKLRTSYQKKKIEVFSIKLTPNKNQPFSSCEALVIDNNATNFIFGEIPFNSKLALGLAYTLERDVKHNGILDYDDFVAANGESASNPYNSFTVEGSYEGKMATITLSTDGETMNVTAHTSIVNENRPDINGSRSGEFIPDMTQVFEQAKKMVSLACTMGMINGETVGTKELIEESNTVVFEVIDSEKLSSEEEVAVSNMEEGELLNLQSKDNMFYVANAQGVVLGRVPKSLEMAIDILYANNMIKECIGISNDNGILRAAIRFDLTSSKKETYFGNTVKRYQPHFEISYINEDGKRGHSTYNKGNFGLTVVGIKYRENWEEMMADITAGDELMVEFDHENEFDETAIKVSKNGKLVGYVAKNKKPVVMMFMKQGLLKALVEYAEEDCLDITLSPTRADYTDEYNDVFNIRVSMIEKEKTDKGYVESIIPKEIAEFIEFLP